MDEARFDILTRQIGRERSRRGLLTVIVAGTAGGLAAMAPGWLADVAAKKKRKKRRCKKSGAVCRNDKECCPSKTQRFCGEPDLGSDETACCGVEGSACGGRDAGGNELPPFCCNGQSFFCPGDPNMPRRCIVD